MSLLGRKPIPIPSGTTVTVDGAVVTAKGPQGTLSVAVHPDIQAVLEGAQIWIRPAAGREQVRGVSAQWGTSWALVRNAVEGVSKGFTKRLELHGVGYRAEISGRTLRLSVGFTHQVEVAPPEGLVVSVEKNTITVHGADKALVGAYAAAVRRVRPPEPYKGKGIRYVGEIVRRKVGKVAGGAAAA